MKALIVDDSRAIRAIIRRILRDLGFETLEAGNGREALDKLATADVQLAVVDWNMPVMDGYALVRALRDDSTHDPMRILMVTTETGAEWIAAALAAGASEYLMKPFTRDAVMEKLALLGLVEV